MFFYDPIMGLQRNMISSLTKKTTKSTILRIFVEGTVKSQTHFIDHNSEKPNKVCAKYKVHVSKDLCMLLVKGYIIICFQDIPWPKKLFVYNL